MIFFFSSVKPGFLDEDLYLFSLVTRLETSQQFNFIHVKGEQVYKLYFYIYMKLEKRTFSPKAVFGLFLFGLQSKFF